MSGHHWRRLFARGSRVALWAGIPAFTSIANPSPTTLRPHRRQMVAEIKRCARNKNSGPSDLNAELQPLTAVDAILDAVLSER